MTSFDFSKIDIIPVGPEICDAERALESDRWRADTAPSATSKSNEGGLPCPVGGTSLVILRVELALIPVLVALAVLPAVSSLSFVLIYVIFRAALAFCSGKYTPVNQLSRGASSFLWFYMQEI